MKTKQKSFVALLATLAIGTASVAGLAFGYGNAPANNGLVANAETVEAVSEIALVEGTNTVDLTAGVQTSAVISSQNAGYYTFSYTGGFDFDTNQSVTVTVNGAAHTLSIEERSFSVYLTSPSAATVTLATTIDVSLIFDLSYGYVELGANAYSFDEITSVSTKFGVSYTGFYTLTYVSGAGTIAIGENSYTLSEEGEAQKVYLTDVANLDVTVSSYDGSTELSFTLAYSFIELGENTLTSADNGIHVINSVNAGNYAFTWKSGSGTLTINGTSYTLSGRQKEHIVYLDNSSNYGVTVSVPSSLVFELTYDMDINYLTVDETATVSLTANKTSYAVISIWNENPGYVENEDGTLVHSTSAVAGYYTFTVASLSSDTASVNFSFVDLGVLHTYTLSAGTQSFTAYIAVPQSTVISLVSAEDATISFKVSYSATDPSVTGNALILGSQEVKADGEGVEYTFTSENGGTYTLSCTDDNAFIMVETEYGADWVEMPYTFTLSASETVIFYMATNDWEEDAYTVTIEKA